MKPGFEQCDAADFEAHMAQYLQRVRQSNLPLFITDSDEAAVVVLSVSSFMTLQQYALGQMDVVGRMTGDQLGKAAATSNPKGKATTAATKKARSKKNKDDVIYQLKITLKHIRPPIWRRVLVPGSLTLSQLHGVIQTAMAGWYDSHLHEFEIDGAQYGLPAPPGDNWGMPVTNEAKVTLENVLREKQKFLYTYDFGDDWQHEILVEKLLARDPTMNYPICLKGKRACPPEDCGGPWGYAELLEILANPHHPEYESRQEWLIADFDAEVFDLEAVNEALGAIG